MKDRSGFPNPLDMELDPRDRGGRTNDDYDYDHARHPAPRPMRRGRSGVRQPWRMTGVGSAAGYTGFGGPGWSSGGFGDPGYNTSGFDSPHYGASRIGTMSSNDYTAHEYGHDRYGDYAPVDVAPRTGAFGSRSSEGARNFRGVGPKGFKRSDERISEEICQLLTDDDRIDARGIEVSVNDGEVTLSGNVPERRMKWLAEEVIESVGGVREVNNRLKGASRLSNDPNDLFRP